MPDDEGIEPLDPEYVEPVEMIEVFISEDAWPQPMEEWGEDVVDEEPGVITE